jgi:hypothetical protein
VGRFSKVAAESGVAGALNGFILLDSSVGRVGREG